MGLLARYMSGLCVAVLGLCASGWLMLAPVAFGYRGSAPHGAVLADRATGAGLAVVSLLTLTGWAIAWRRKLRADGVLPRISRGQARREARELRRRAAASDHEGASGPPDPAQVLSELRALLFPLLAEPPPAPQEPPVPAAAPEPAAAEPAAVPEVHHQRGGVPEPRSELAPFRPPDGAAPGPGQPEGYQAAGPGPYDFTPALVLVPAVPVDQLTPAEPPRPSGIAAIESMLAGAELSMAGCGEEETW
jgi:hypothetical protein